MRDADDAHAVYRTDIDGLRAIAVLLVVYTHMGLPFITGGFIGVDVFFVISGFLITRLMVNDIREGRFSFKRFYLRRIRRLAPALVVVLFATLAVGAILLSPKDLITLATATVWVLLLAGNFFHWLNFGGYFAQDSEQAPLLHTWSLAVEEQYYLIWPLVLFFIIRWLGPRTRALAVLIVCIAGALFSEFALDYTIGAAYYLLPTRAFELLVGASVALVLPHFSRVPPWLATVGSLLGLLLVSYMSITLNEGSRFPGLNALWVCLGAGMLIFFGAIENPVSRMLSIRPMRFVGDLSYSLYLWHWPMIVYVSYVGLPESVLLDAVLFIAMLLISYVTVHAVERPFRFRYRPSLPASFVLWLVLPLSVATGAAGWINAKDGLPARFENRTVDIEAALARRTHEMRPQCHSPQRQWRKEPNDDCRVGVTENPGNHGLLFGDSHANHLVGFLDVLGRARGESITDYTMDRCKPLLGIGYGGNAVEAERCAGRNKLVEEWVIEKRPDAVYLGASWPGGRGEIVRSDRNAVERVSNTEERFYEDLRMTVERLVALNVKPVLFSVVAYAEHADPFCPLRNAMFLRDNDCSFAYYPNEMMARIESRLSSEFDVLEIIDLKPFYCSDKTCAASFQGIPIYFDSNHINYTAAELFGETYVQKKRTHSGAISPNR